MALTKDTFNLRLLSDTTQYIEIYSADGSEDFTSDYSKKLYWLNKSGVLGIYDKKYNYLGFYEVKNNSLSFIKIQL